MRNTNESPKPSDKSVTSHYLLLWKVSLLWHSQGRCRPDRCRGLHPPSSPFGWLSSGSRLSVQCLKEGKKNACFISDDAICALAKQIFRIVAALHLDLLSNSKEAPRMDYWLSPRWSPCEINRAPNMLLLALKWARKILCPNTTLCVHGGAGRACA